MRKHLVPFAVVAVLGGGLVPSAAATADASTTKPVVYKNCKALNAKYRYGVRVSASTRNVVHSGGAAVKKSSKALVNAKLYAANKKLDADRDGIACEK